MPQPNKSKESRDKYMSRCMSSDEMQKKHPKQSQRYAVCANLWEKGGD